MKMEHFEYAECENISRNLNEAKGEAKGQVEGDALFIEIVRGYPHIYTKNFKDKEKRDQSWAEIATTCNCSGMWNLLYNFATKIYLQKMV